MIVASNTYSRFDDDIIELFEVNSTITRRVTREVGVDQHLIWNVLMAAAEIIRTSPDIFRRMRRSLLQRYVACRSEDGSHFEHLLRHVN